MAGIFFAMVFAGWVPIAFFFFGLAMALIATVLYARDGSAGSARASATSSLGCIARRGQRQPQVAAEA